MSIMVTALSTDTAPAPTLPWPRPVQPGLRSANLFGQILISPCCYWMVTGMVWHFAEIQNQ